VSEAFDIDAEEVVIGFCLMYPKGIQAVVEKGLAPEHFFQLDHQDIWRAMLKRFDAGQPIDALLIEADLGATKGSVDALTGSGYGNASTALAHAGRVVELALWRSREYAAAAMQIACESLDEQAFAQAEADLAVPHRPDENTYSPAQLAEQVFAMLENSEQTFSWPWPRFNRLTSGGMRRGEVTLLGGWTSHGKSVVLDMILDRCASDGLNVHLFINEMAPRQRAARTVSRRSGVLLGSILNNELDEKQRALVLRALNDLPYPITDAAGWNAVQIARAIRRLRCDVVGVDILHLIEHRDERDLAGISAELNRAAKMADCHIVATVHLNEGRVVGQTRPMPTLGDIRGSGMLKNDADNVLFVFREQDADTGYPQHEATGYFAKVRSGIPGGVPLTFDGARMEFTERGSWRTAA
jgi:replicative DNA helicase